MTNETSKQPQVMGTAAAGIRLGLYLVFSYVLGMYIPSIPFLSLLYLIALYHTDSLKHSAMLTPKSYHSLLFLHGAMAHRLSSLQVSS